MAELKGHWTETSIEDFLHRLSFDFMQQIHKILESGPLSQAALAERLGVSEGSVSQALNNPGNLTLKRIVQYARVLGHKVAVVAYDDRDPNNLNGPINAEIFSSCWERAGRPTDFFDLRDVQAESANLTFVIQSGSSSELRSGFQSSATTTDRAVQRITVIDTASNSNAS